MKTIEEETTEGRKALTKLLHHTTFQTYLQLVVHINTNISAIGKIWLRESNPVVDTAKWLEEMF